jgi:hypothetical protein
MPELEPTAEGEQGGQETGNKFSRSEKKSRKAIQKLGMKPYPDVTRVTLKKSKNVGNPFSSFFFSLLSFPCLVL